MRRESRRQAAPSELWKQEPACTSTLGPTKAWIPRKACTSCWTRSNPLPSPVCLFFTDTASKLQEQVCSGYRESYSLLLTNSWPILRKMRRTRMSHDPFKIKLIGVAVKVPSETAKHCKKITATIGPALICHIFAPPDLHPH